MEKEQRREINNLCFNMGIMPQKAVDLYSATSFEVTIQVLEEVKQSENDLLTKRVLFNRVAERARKAFARDQKANDQKADYDKMVRKWEQAQENGYVPSKKTIFNQLLVEHNAGKITDAEYEIGTTLGLNMIKEQRVEAETCEEG